MVDALPVDGQRILQPVHELSDDLTVSEYAQAVAQAGERMISVIVPTSHDRSILSAALDRLVAALSETSFTFEILVVDDYSEDGTRELVRSMEGRLPIRFIEKQGARGRSFSIKDGIDQAVGGIIVLLDPDVQFPPHSLQHMLDALQHAPIAVATRMQYQSVLYGLFSRAYRWIFGSILLSVNTDVRSGFKMFRRSVLDPLRFAPGFDPRLGFDALLLYHAHRAGWAIASVRIDYLRPAFHHGIWSSVSTRIDLAVNILALRAAHISRILLPFLYPPEPQEYFEAGFTNINDYLFLSPEQSAKGHLTREAYFLVFYTFLFVLLYFWGIQLVIGKGFLWSFFFHVAIVQCALVLFKLYVVWVTFQLPPQPPRMLAPEEMTDLPTISVICPVYKEKEIIPQLCKRMAEMRYPIDKLDFIFIFESGDDETIQAFLDQHPPAHFKGLVSPDVQPKTKPKALNVALRETKGDLIVIFDAETLPEPDQFLKVVAALKYDPTIDYVHCRIDVYNPSVNWITKMYTAEFAFFYNFFLPGLATVKSPTPISGHSVYFRREQVVKIGGWDAYNLAEDCDIGIRLFRNGYKNATVLDSYSWEQSTTTLGDWIKQRTRWMQGFVQTSMVNLRFPALLWKDLGGLRNVLMFMFHVPGGVFLNGLNLVQWCILLFWYVTRDPGVQSIFSGVLLYISVASFVMANALFTYFNLIGLLWRKYYSLVPTALMSLFYWLLLSIATVRAILRFFRQESTWDKTSHPVLPVSAVQL